jgi:alpha-glucosidase
MNGASARTLELPLSFLAAAKHRAVLVRDSEKGPAAVEIEKATLSRTDTLKVELQPGGGFVALVEGGL